MPERQVFQTAQQLVLPDRHWLPFATTLSEENGNQKECALSLACCMPWRQTHWQNRVEKDWGDSACTPAIITSKIPHLLLTMLKRWLWEQLSQNLTAYGWSEVTNVKPQPRDCSSETMLYSGSYILKIAWLSLHHVHGIEQLLLFPLSNSDIESFIPNLRIFLITTWQSGWMLVIYFHFLIPFFSMGKKSF